ncbi:hypothetical protein [Roseicella frigidaeris]|uniref:Uncharacterized protein n=1 Tax=Roseicella frigidaeris TaxID=2230885 RepID=A0A327M9M6_9PROT|nr:hypothetical protein [Roseicella frigidaeris]RAI59177.1 hypothetical protein DOO78_09040 [Roseicella frigidaeris]
MVKLSLVILVVLTVLIGMGLRWREERQVAIRAATVRRGDWMAAQKRKLNRWVTAACLATLTTILVLGGLHWLRVLQQG